VNAKHITKLLCRKNNITFLQFSLDYKILDFDEHIVDLASDKQNLKIGMDVREAFCELIGFEENIQELLDKTTQPCISIPMLNKNGFYYNLEIEFCEVDSHSFFIMYFMKKTKYMLNYTKMVQDINKKTLLLENEKKVQEKREHYYSLINKKLVTFNVDNDGFITDVNDTCSYFFDLKKDDMIGEHFSKFIKARENNLRDAKVFRATKFDGECVYFHTDIIPLSSKSGQYGNIIISQDITYLKKIEEELIYAVKHDSLTGLANRSLLMEKIDEAIVESKEKGSFFALCFVDLDKFKYINDNYGHHAGDMLLKHISKLLQGLIREEDTAARVGGDEFVVLIRNIQDKDFAELSVQRIDEALRGTPLVYTKDSTIYFSCSFGIGIFPNDGEDGSTLLKFADEKMYMKKRSR